MSVRAQALAGEPWGRALSARMFQVLETKDPATSLPNSMGFRISHDSSTADSSNQGWHQTMSSFRFSAPCPWVLACSLGVFLHRAQHGSWRCHLQVPAEILGGKGQVFLPVCDFSSTMETLPGPALLVPLARAGSHGSPTPSQARRSGVLLTGPYQASVGQGAVL